jgi:hypoxanthine phosphoribosyltransferase
LLNLIKKVFKKEPKEVIVTNEMKVQQLSEKAIGLVDSFRKTHEELGEINNQLQQIIKEETQKIILIERNRDKAWEEMQMNKKLQEKLAEFIR